MTATLSSSTRTNSLWLDRPPADTRVVVAMSGGVDSSVVAALLKNEGYDVIGITLQLYDHGTMVGKAGSCCAGRDIHDARRVAQQLGIAHYVLDYEKRFESAVMQAFADSYIKGETPIPCVTCNQKIKFAELLETARDLGADVLATGHYIQSRPGSVAAAVTSEPPNLDQKTSARLSSPATNKASTPHSAQCSNANPGHNNPPFNMYRAIDADRDQSYFLFATTPAQLQMLRFPLGHMPKSKVRALAHSYGLDIADKKDSQDICFVPTGRYAQVIEKLHPGANMAGDIVHIDGRTLGRHDGIINFTIGQRRGLGIPASEPLYVVRLDAALNQVIVGPKCSLHAHWMTLRDVNWLGDYPLSSIPLSGLDIYARIRSTGPPQPATLFTTGSDAKTSTSGPGDLEVRVLLKDGEEGIAAGQACVFYADNSACSQVLGGGWIIRALSRADASTQPPGSP